MPAMRRCVTLRDVARSQSAQLLQEHNGFAPTCCRSGISRDMPKAGFCFTASGYRSARQRVASASHANPTLRTHSKK